MYGTLAAVIGSTVAGSAGGSADTTERRGARGPVVAVPTLRGVPAVLTGVVLVVVLVVIAIASLGLVVGLFRVSRRPSAR